jgi:hypothetical protein
MSGDANSGSPGPIPAGWYADPSGGDGKRWWDGGQWTNHVQQPLAVAQPPAFGGPGPMQFRPMQPTASVQKLGVGIEDTRAAWWIAFSPIWSIVGQAIVVSIILALTSAPVARFVPALIILNVVLWAVVIGLAVLDHAKLRSGGNTTAASPLWVLLTPLAYLIVRAQHVRMYAAGGWTVVIWWCVAAFLAPGLAVLGIFASYGVFAF